MFDKLPAVKTPTPERKRWVVGRLPWRRSRRYRLAIADASGSVAVEFALLLPVFLSLVIGTVEIGRVLYTTHALGYAAREGVRYAMVRGADNPTPATTTNIEDIVKARATALDPAKMVIAVTYAPDNSPGSLVTVQVTYDHEFFMPFYSFESINLTNSSQRIVTY